MHGDFSVPADSRRNQRDFPDSTAAHSSFAQGTLLIVLLVPFLFFFQAYPNYRNPNELSRLLLVSAIVDDGSFSIDNALKRYGECQDVSFYGGKYYSNKAIGYSLFGVPLYYTVTRILGVSNEEVIFYLLRIFMNLIPLLLFAGLFQRYLERDLGLGRRSYLLLAAFLYGTLIFPYAQVFASHMLTGLLWFLAFHLTVSRKGLKSAAIAGSVLGASFLMEIPTLLILPLFLLWILIHRRPAFIPFAAGFMIFSAPAFLYNAAVFEGPLNWSYKYVVTPELRAVHDQGFVGASLPSADILWKLTFGSNRGFFHFMPHLLFGIAGLLATLRVSTSSWLVLSVIGVNFLFYSGYASWDGGWSFGPRFLVSLIPFFMYGCALWLSGLRKAVSGLANAAESVYLVLVGISISAMLMGAATFTISPRFLPWILLWEVPVLFWRGFWGLNWGDLFGFTDWVIQTAAILTVLIPVFWLLVRSRIGMRRIAMVLAGIVLSLSVSRVFLTSVESRMSAAHCLAIGRIGFIQAQYSKGLVFLNMVEQKTDHPAIRQEAEQWKQAITDSIPATQNAPVR